jgi:hypothetical protein
MSCRPLRGQGAHLAHGPAGAMQAGEGLVNSEVGVHGGMRTRRAPLCNGKAQEGVGLVGADANAPDQLPARLA